MFLSLWLCFFAVILQTFIAGAIIMLAKASLLVVFALAPLLLAGLFFPQTAKFADAWFNQSLNYVLTVVIAAFFLQIANALFNQQLSSIDANIQDDAISFVDLGKMTLLTIINFFVIKQSPSIASGLAGGVSSGSASLIGMARGAAAPAALFNAGKNLVYGPKDSLQRKLVNGAYSATANRLNRVLGRTNSVSK
ncbi:hypothetical protein NX88_11380, partial [Neisseria meningitidis]